MECLPIGRMVPLQATPPAPPAATCARCGCQLSRYRDYSDGAYCAPCKAAVKAEAATRTPTFAPTPPERRCSCGTPLHRDTKGSRCRACYASGRATRRCSDCAKPIPGSNKSGLCQACFYWNRAATRPKPAPCPDCGGPKSRNSRSCCLDCSNKRRVHPERVCPECGGPKPLKRALLCRKCRDKAGGARNAHKVSA